MKGLVTRAPKRIGDLSDDAATMRRVGEFLRGEYSEITTEVSSDGKQYIPLREVLKFDARRSRDVTTAYDKGLAEGHSVGLAKGREEAKKVFNAFGKATRDCIEQRETLLRQAELHIVELILKIAKKLTFDAAKLDSEITAGIVKGAIASLVDKREITIEVHPDHLPVLEQQMDEFQSMSSDIRKLSLKADPRVGYGGCFIRTPSGDVDARLESQFEIIDDTIRGASE